MCEQALDMFLQFVANAERMVQLLDQFCLLRCELEGMSGIQGGEERIGHLIIHAIT